MNAQAEALIAHAPPAAPVETDGAHAQPAICPHCNLPVPAAHGEACNSIMQNPSHNYEAFAAAVKQALKDFHIPPALASSPLLHTRIVSEPTPRALQQALRAACEGLRGYPRTERLRRAVWHTYIQPAHTQELAAELLGLPFTTYRYQLVQGVRRITEALWRVQCGDTGP